MNVTTTPPTPKNRGGRPRKDDARRARVTVRLDDRERQLYERLGGVEWLRRALAQAQGRS